MSEINLVENIKEKNILESYDNRLIGIEIFEKLNKINSIFINKIREN